MNCYCDRCNGEGEITCPDCDGQGVIPGDLAVLEPPPNHPHRDELLALRDDLLRVREQAKELAALNPARADRYREQLNATEKTIEAQATKLWNKQ
jgi:hypothetical protein